MADTFKVVAKNSSWKINQKTGAYDKADAVDEYEYDNLNEALVEFLVYVQDGIQTSLRFKPSKESE